MLEQAKRVAADLAREAGALARQAFLADKRIDLKGDCGDVVTEIDRQAERLIADGLHRAFPDHGIFGEEFGWLGNRESEWLWLIDPLDGTNNYVIGLPAYAVSITAVYQGEVQLGVVYDSNLDLLYIAEREKGVTVNGRPLRMRPPQMKHLTLAWVQGHQVQKDPVAIRLRWHLEQHSKRVLCLWAPTLIWCMLARGDLDGIVSYRSGGVDLYAGLLVAKEAGACVMDFCGQPVVGIEEAPCIIACHPERREEMLRLVRQGWSEGGTRLPHEQKRMMEA